MYITQKTQLNNAIYDYLKKHHLGSQKCDKLTKYTLFDKYVYNHSNIESMINSKVKTYFFNNVISNISFLRLPDNTINKNIWNFNNDIIFIKVLKNSYSLFIKLDNNYNYIIELSGFKSIDSINEFLEINIFGAVAGVDFNYILNNTLNYDYCLYSLNRNK